MVHLCLYAGLWLTSQVTAEAMHDTCYKVA